MTIMNINPTDICITHKVLYGIENMISSTTNTKSIKISGKQSDSSKAMYAFHPTSKRLVEIDPTQAWFWKSSWLKDELEVEKELQSGNFEEFDNINDFIDSI